LQNIKFEPNQHKFALRADSPDGPNKFKKFANQQRDFYAHINMFTALLEMSSWQEKLARYGASSLNEAIKGLREEGA
jgi:hypothetical protein